MTAVLLFITKYSITTYWKISYAKFNDMLGVCRHQCAEYQLIVPSYWRNMIIWAVDRTAALKLGRILHLPLDVQRGNFRNLRVPETNFTSYSCEVFTSSFYTQFYNYWKFLSIVEICFPSTSSTPRTAKYVSLLRSFIISVDYCSQI